MSFDPDTPAAGSPPPVMRTGRAAAARTAGILAAGAFALLALAAVVVAVALTNGSGARGSWEALTAPATSTSRAAPVALAATEAPRATGGAPGLDAPGVADIVIPSVVYVEVSDGSRRGGTEVVASGSGVVLDRDGHVVTNGHVVTAGRSYRVVLAGGRTYEATLAGLDQTTDLAVLEIGAEDLAPISLGSSDVLRVGDPVVAVGSPLGLEGGPSLTVGVVSAFGRQVQTGRTSVLYGMLQTDAAITEGSSGGALVDSDGRLVGITTAVGVSAVGIEGIGFATPVEIVARVSMELIRDGEASQPALGISGATAYRELDDGGQQPTGVRVETVKGGSPAAAAGIRSGDVIVKLGGSSIDTMDELLGRMRRYEAGSRLTVTLLRDEQELTLDLAI